MRHLMDIALIIGLLALPIVLFAQGPSTTPDASRALNDLFEAEWDYDMRENPVRASLLGDRRWNDRWPEESSAAEKRRHDHYRQVLDKLAAIERTALSISDQLNYDLFRRDYQIRVEQYGTRWHLVPLDQRGGIQTTGELAETLRFATTKDYEDWIARLRAFPAYMNDTIGVMREAISARIVQPKIIVSRVQGQVDKLAAGPPGKSPYFKPLTRFPDTIPAATRTELAAAANDAIAKEVIPSFERFRTFLADEYYPAAFDRPGIWQIPDGDETYAFFARRFTTTGMTPKEIHQKGVDEVERIHREMLAILSRTGFKGSLPEFFAFLRTDPRFYYKTPDELLVAYRTIAKRIDPALVKAFKTDTLPRMPYGVEPIPEITAPDTTTAYYSQPAADGSRPGTYYVNLYKPETRPTYEMMALSLHEAVPGHHLQIALAMERPELPKFRRHGGYTAFVEGWALYGESLGEEMGLYDDPYSKFGQLTYEMWRAVRLVVDTGMHSMKWDRQQAIDYFKEHAPKAENDIVNEIDRYIAWPGQALAYKVGELKIKELRTRASRALGSRFDLRAFHHAVLENGALPLEILEQRVDAWIDASKATPTPSR